MKHPVYILLIVTICLQMKLSSSLFAI